MSTEADKFNHSKRLQQSENAVKKQLKIAKQHNAFSDENKVIKEPHRLEKHHAMDCGQPGCMLCGNPRKVWHELTAQEKRMFQETEITRMRHSNGTLPEDDDE
jgi:hypothetical protein